MFGNKKKIDSKIRFQNNRFKRELRQARSYKRPTRKMPKTDWEVFLSRIGLGSWLARFATLLVFLLVIYLVFIPNFLFIKNIQILGLTPQTQSGAMEITNSFLSKNLPWPQKNILLLSKKDLKNYLLQNDQQILSVDAINKKLPATLTVKVTPRVDEFTLETASTTYLSVANDGLTTSHLFINASGSLPSNLVLIKLTQEGDDISLNQAALTRSQIGFLTSLENQLPGIAKSSIDHFETLNLQAPDINAILKNGVIIKFDFSSDLSDVLNQLNQLISQLLPGDLKRLYYVDMRFEGRGYVCYQNTACVNPMPVPSQTASTTPTS